MTADFPDLVVKHLLDRIISLRRLVKHLLDRIISLWRLVKHLHDRIISLWRLDYPATFY
jgi:hypothetical protein